MLYKFLFTFKHPSGMCVHLIYFCFPNGCMIFLYSCAPYYHQTVTAADYSNSTVVEWRMKT